MRYYQHFTDVPLADREQFIAGKLKEIPSYDQLSRPDAEKVIFILADHFKTKCPRLRWSRRSKRGKYMQMSNVISSGPNAWRGVTNCLLHEFAHNLAQNRYIKDHIASHGDEFRNTLVEVVEVWHGKQSDYAWKQEYKAIVKWATKKGILQPEVTLAVAAESAQA